jgi:hypothetical protein
MTNRSVPVTLRRLHPFVLVIAFLSTYYVALLGPILPAIAGPLGGDALAIGLLFSTYSLAQFLTAPVMGALGDRYGRRMVLVLSLVGALIGFSIFTVGAATGAGLWALFLGWIIVGACDCWIGIQRSEHLATGDVDAAEEQIMTNLLGPIRLTAALMSQLISRPTAAIVNVTSGLAFVPNAAVPTYCATKAALHSYTQCLRHQLRATTVEVIEIIPPQVRTALREVDDPRAMPLDDYIAETMTLLTAGGLDEIAVARVIPLRHAERDHTYNELFGAMNPPRPAGAPGSGMTPPLRQPDMRASR